MDRHRRARTPAKPRVDSERPGVRAAGVPARVVPLVIPRARSREPGRPDGCAKCGSTFVAHEPAFVHCHYCGSLTRIPGASLLDQELFEIRSGLRLAS